MTAHRWQRLEELFHAMLALQPEQRAAALTEMCGDDDELRAEVERLLHADEKASAFVGSTAARHHRRSDAAQLSGGAADERADRDVRRR